MVRFKESPNVKVKYKLVDNLYSRSTILIKTNK